ncbi:outer membrane beta-barrel protein [Spirosoma pomorum]
MKNLLTIPVLTACLLSLHVAQAQFTPSANTQTTPEKVTLATTTDEGTSSNTAPTDMKRTKADYKNFAFGIYAGLNSTKLPGESNSSNGNISGRLGYQAGFFVRGGGRLFGQVGAEYFASSSNYFTAGSGQSASSIQDQINIQYVQVPVYIGYKITESDRGISAVRVQLGVEYANRINSNSNSFNVSNAEIKSGTFNGLGQVGFDAGPVFLDLTYHYGFSDAIQGTGFNGSARRILSASVGFKF